MARHIHVTLPARAQLNTVAYILALAAGAPFSVGEANGAPYPIVRNVTTAGNASEPTMARIMFTGADNSLFSANYHFEFGKNGSRGMLLPETGQWLAFAKCLVQLLGGKIEVEHDNEDKVVEEQEDRWPSDPGEEDFAWLAETVMSVKPVDAEAIALADAFLASIR